MIISGGLPFDSSSSSIEHRHICSSCHYLLIEPKFLQCSHRYCSVCLKKIIETKQPAICSENDCGQTIAVDEIYPDLPMENELKRLTNLVCHNKVKGCVWQGDYLSYKNHLLVCTFESFRCEYCSTSFTNRSLYEQHSQICPKAFVLCPLKKFGCNTQIRREGLHDHVISSLEEHLQLLADFPNQSLTETQDIKSLRTELAKQGQIIEQLRLEQKSLQSMLVKREQELARACVGVQLCKGELCDLKKEVELSKTFLHNDGTYIWCINNIHELFRNAKNSSQPMYITSSPFYTSKYGYKLSLRLYLNGDKSVRDTYLSLYVTIMYGEYDSLLKWPFSYPITLCLYDRSSKHDHVVHTLTPDITSVCFERPRMLANKSGGIPEFCPLWKVFSKEFGYVRQDEMFIKAFVDFNIYPKNIWPQWTQLQPYGFPVHIEHIKLKELIEKLE